MRVIQRLGLLAVVFIGLMMAESAPASARSNQLSGVAVYDSTRAPRLPPDTTTSWSYPGLRMSGSLAGCLYTNVDTVHDNGAPSGVYLETGREVFVGTLDGGPVGTFATTYRFESKWDPDVSPAQRSADDASTPSRWVAGPMVSLVRLGASTSRTSWLTGASSIEVTSAFREPRRRDLPGPAGLRVGLRDAAEIARCRSHRGRNGHRRMPDQERPDRMPIGRSAWSAEAMMSAGDPSRWATDRRIRARPVPR